MVATGTVFCCQRCPYILPTTQHRAGYACRSPLLHSSPHPGNTQGQCHHHQPMAKTDLRAGTWAACRVNFPTRHNWPAGGSSEEDHRCTGAKEQGHSVRTPAKIPQQQWGNGHHVPVDIVWDSALSCLWGCLAGRQHPEPPSDGMARQRAGPSGALMLNPRAPPRPINAMTG